MTIDGAKLALGGGRGAAAILLRKQTSEPPANVERLTLSGGSRFLSADDIALIESWLIKGASLRMLLGAWDAIRFRLALKNNPDLESRLRPIIERNAKVAVVVGSRKRRISHCKYGHELTIENTGIKPSNGSRLARLSRLKCWTTWSVGC